MNNKSFIIAALGAFALCAASCTEKVEAPGIPEGPTALKDGPIGAVCRDLPSETDPTKSAFVYGDVEKKKMIRSVRVFIFEHGGAFVATESWKVEAPVKVFYEIDLDGMVDEGRLDEKTSYDFYFLANIPDETICSDIDDITGGYYSDEMEGCCFALQDYSSFNTYGFPMEAHFSNKTVYEIISSEEPIEFTRLVSQWKVTLKDTGSGVTFDNCSVAVRNAAKTIQPFSSHPAPAQVFNNNILASGDHGNMSIAASGDVAYFYVLENMCGEFFPDAENMYDRDVNAKQGNSSVAPTYIEITSKGTIDGTALIIDNTVYRYALGDGNITNADAGRHTEYNVSLNFTETAAENEGWVKEIGDPYVENPHVEFDASKYGVILDKVNASIPFDNATKNMIALGEIVNSEWMEWNEETRKLVSSTGPKSERGDVLTELITTETGVTIQPSEGAILCLNRLKTANPQYTFEFSIRNSGLTGVGDLLYSSLDDLLSEGYAEKNGNVISIKIKSPNAGEGYYVHSYVTNAKPDEYSENRYDYFPVCTGPLYIKVSSGVNINKWNILSNTAAWAQNNWSSLESREAGLWAPFVRKQAPSLSGFYSTAKSLLNLPFYSETELFKSKILDVELDVWSNGSYIKKGRYTGSTVYNVPDRAREDDYTWGDNMLLEFADNGWFGSEEWFDEVYYDSRYKTLGARVEFHYYHPDKQYWIITGESVALDVSGLYEEGLPYWYVPVSGNPEIRVMPVFFHLCPED